MRTRIVQIFCGREGREGGSCRDEYQRREAGDVDLVLNRSQGVSKSCKYIDALGPRVPGTGFIVNFVVFWVS